MLGNNINFLQQVMGTDGTLGDTLLTSAQSSHWLLCFPQSFISW